MSLKPIEKLKLVKVHYEQIGCMGEEAPKPMIVINKINEIIEVVNEQSEVIKDQDKIIQILCDDLSREIQKKIIDE